MTDTCTWLIRIQTAPYVSAKATLGIDATLACGAFGQSVTLVLEGPGIELLTAPKEPVEGGRNLFKLLASLPLYDVERVYLLTENPNDGASGELLNDELGTLKILPLTSKELASLIANSRHVLSF